MKDAISKFNAFKKVSAAIENPVLDALINKVDKQLEKLNKAASKK